MPSRTYVTLSPDERNALLRRAALSGDALAVCDLLAAGAFAHDYALTGGGRETPLMAAARLGHTDCVIHLIQQGKVNWRWAAGQATALFLAAQAGHAQCVKALAPQSDCNLAGPRGHTPLMIAALNGHLDCVNKLLAQQSVVVDAVDPRGATASFLAASEGHADCVKTLATRADVNKRANMGQTPLTVAISRGHVDCVSILLAQPLVDLTFGLNRPLASALEHAMDCAASESRNAQSVATKSQEPIRAQHAMERASAVAECLILVAERHGLEEVKALEAKIKPEVPRLTAWIEQQELALALGLGASGPHAASLERRGMRL